MIHCLVAPNRDLDRDNDRSGDKGHVNSLTPNLICSTCICCPAGFQSILQKWSQRISEALQIGLTGLIGVWESRANPRILAGSYGGGSLAPAGRVGCRCGC
jgi:hypothetical protein